MSEAHYKWNTVDETQKKNTIKETIRSPSNFPYIAISSSCKCNWRRWQGNVEYEWDREARVRELCKKRGIELWNSEDGNGHNFVSCHFRRSSLRKLFIMHACSEPELTDVHPRSCAVFTRGAIEVRIHARMYICFSFLFGRNAFLNSCEKICSPCTICSSYKTRYLEKSWWVDSCDCWYSINQ